MEITKTYYASDAKAWRAWLKKNHKTEKEIWLVYYNKKSGKSRVEYHDAVDEALCFGWIDSTSKKIDEHSYAQRFTPRKPKSNWSELNKERVRKLIAQKKMTKAGMDVLTVNISIENFKIPNDILKALKKNKIVWSHFQTFSETYQRVRISYINESRLNEKEFQKRLDHFIKKTEQKKQFGLMR